MVMCTHEEARNILRKENVRKLAEGGLMDAEELEGVYGEFPFMYSEGDGNEDHIIIECPEYVPAELKEPWEKALNAWLMYLVALSSQRPHSDQLTNAYGSLRDFVKAFSLWAGEENPENKADVFVDELLDFLDTIMGQYELLVSDADYASAFDFYSDLAEYTADYEKCKNDWLSIQSVEISDCELTEIVKPLLLRVLIFFEYCFAHSFGADSYLNAKRKDNSEPNKAIRTIWQQLQAVRQWIANIESVTGSKF